MDRLSLDIENHITRHLEHLSELLGQDPGPQWGPDAVKVAAERLSGQLASRETGVAHAAAGLLLELLDLDEPAHARTPLGVELARRLRSHQTLTRAEAARLLQVTSNQIHNLVADGKLERAPKGRGVTRGSVAHRLATVQPRKYRQRP